MTNDTASRANGEARPDLTDVHFQSLRLWGVLAALDILQNEGNSGPEAGEAVLHLTEIAKRAARELTDNLEGLMG